MTHPSVKKRFIISLISNVFRAGLSFATSMILARAMGPGYFGKLSFLLGTFLAFRQLLDLGTSSAFFTFLSKQPRSARFIAFYLAWLGLQFVLCLALLAIVFPSSWISIIWHGESRVLVLLTFLATFFQAHLWPIVTQCFDAYRKTIWIQTFNTLIIAGHLLGIIALYLLGKLMILPILVLMMVEYSLACGIAWWRLSREWQGIEETPQDHFKAVLTQFWTYCKPLLPYTFIAFAYEFVDRWLLQLFGGKEQQAYFQTSQLIASVSLLATVSILRILWKEIAHAQHEGNHTRVFRLYEKTAKSLYFAGAAIMGFLFPWAKVILVTLVGVTYLPGLTAFSIMLLYPVHQSLGQLVGTMMMATEHTRLYSWIGMLGMIAGIIATWFLLAPAQAIVPGLDLGALGIALKYVGLQLIQVNIGIFVLSRLHQWKWEWGFQIWGMAVPLVIGYSLWALTQHLPLPVSIHPFIPLAMCGVGYALCLGAVVFLWPQICGLSRQELRLFK